MTKNVLIVGAGPAGLTAALLLVRQGYNVKLFEADSQYVGGLAKTVEHQGFRLDIGGHRFFTKEKEVQKFWQEIMGEDMLRRNRLSRIYYKEKFLSYPLKPFELITKIPPWEVFSIMTSYIKALIFPPRETLHFEDWIISRFGKKLYQMFFQSYTEKVWGRECTQISADWAVQRINNLNISTIILSFFNKLIKREDGHIKTLLEEFEYPRLGPGMLWERVRDLYLAAGGKLYMGHRLEQATFDQNSLTWSLKFRDHDEIHQGSELINSAPLNLFLGTLGDMVPKKIHQTLDHFKYRAFITVGLIFKGQESFPDNWIYVHDKRVKVARIQNYKNWSPEMVPSKDDVCYGMEYFCQEGDSFWKLSDDELFELAVREIKMLDIPFSEEGLHFCIIRSPKAYPIYDLEYNQRLAHIKNFVSELPHTHLIGRAGLHRYNNQDHSIKTAMITVENIKQSSKIYDPWSVNQDAAYIEG